MKKNGYTRLKKLTRLYRECLFEKYPNDLSNYTGSDFEWHHQKETISEKNGKEKRKSNE